MTHGINVSVEGVRTGDMLLLRPAELVPPDTFGCTPVLAGALFQELADLATSPHALRAPGPDRTTGRFGQVARGPAVPDTRVRP